MQTRAFGHQTVGYGQSDSAAGTRDDGSLALESIGPNSVFTHYFPLSSTEIDRCLLSSNSNYRNVNLHETPQPRRQKFPKMETDSCWLDHSPHRMPIVLPLEKRCFTDTFKRVIPK